MSPLSTCLILPDERSDPGLTSSLSLSLCQSSLCLSLRPQFSPGHFIYSSVSLHLFRADKGFLLVSQSSMGWSWLRDRGSRQTARPLALPRADYRSWSALEANERMLGKNTLLLEERLSVIVMLSEFTPFFFFNFHC